MQGMIDRDSLIIVTGGTGMVGAAVVRLLRSQGFSAVVAPSRAELDLEDSGDVHRYFKENRPRYLLMVAAKVGGIAANAASPVEFTTSNLRITINLYQAMHAADVEKALFLGSSCIYPRSQPALIDESQLLSGPLEPTNEGYALAKIVGLKLAQYYQRQYGVLTVCPMPCNLYGTGDHFDLERSHVLSALVRRFVDARDNAAAAVTLWGTGAARREFLHVDDAARAVLFFMDHVQTSEHVNVGWGEDITIRELADLVRTTTGFEGAIEWDASKPDGMPRKCLDVSRARALGFRPTVTLADGVRRTVTEYEAIKKAKGG